MIISPVQSVESPIAIAPVAAAASQPTAAPAFGKPYYYSPILTIDPQTRTAVLAVRDSTTGDVTAQYPTEKDLKAYAQAQVKPAGISAPADTGTVTFGIDSTVKPAATTPAAPAPADSKSASASTGSVIV